MPEMRAQPLHVGDEIPGGIAVQRGVRRRASAAALVEQDDAVARRVVKAAHGRIGAAARSAMHHHHGLALRIAAFLEIDPVRVVTRPACRSDRAEFPETIPGDCPNICIMPQSCPLQERQLSTALKVSAPCRARQGGPAGHARFRRSGRASHRRCRASSYPDRGDKRLPVNAASAESGTRRAPRRSARRRRTRDSRRSCVMTI